MNGIELDLFSELLGFWEVLWLWIQQVERKKERAYCEILFQSNCTYSVCVFFLGCWFLSFALGSLATSIREEEEDRKRNEQLL